METAQRVNVERFWGPFRDLAASEAVDQIRAYEGLAAELYDAQCSYALDIPMYLEMARRATGPILELGCGTGRVMLPVADEGFTIVGVDRAADMLAILRRKLAARPPAVRARATVLEADAARLCLGRKFALITLPYSTLFLLDDAERAAVLRGVAEHLTPEGIFAFDGFAFDEPGGFHEPQIETAELTFDGGFATMQAGMMPSSDGRFLMCNTYWDVRELDGARRRFLDWKRITLMSRDQIAAELEDAGLVVVAERARQDSAVSMRFFECKQRGSAYALWHPFTPMNDAESSTTTLVLGSGSRVLDSEGNQYIDACGGLWSSQCGLGDPQIVRAITEQLERLSYGTLFLRRSNEPARDLARKLVEIAPGRQRWAYLTCSGSESVELAIKLSRSHFALQGRPEKCEIAYLDESYHGTYFGSMSVSGLFDDKNAFAPLLPGVVALPTPRGSRRPLETTEEMFANACADVFEDRARRGTLAAVIVEPVLGSAGVIIPPQSYFRRIVEICRRYDVLLVADEVATGFGRTGRWFASEHFGLEPDIVLMSKGISSGYLPLGAVVFSERIGRVMLSRGAGIGHGSTQNGNPACCAAGIATIAKLEDEHLVERAAETGTYLAGRLAELREYEPIGGARGLGMMLAVDLVQTDGSCATAAQTGFVYDALRSSGVLTYPGPGCIIITPPLVMRRAEADAVVEIFHGVASTVALHEGSVSRSKTAG